jgi:arylsulfatase A-like enzyme
MAMRTDQLLGKLFRLIDEKVGLKNTLIILSADHGVSAAPEQEKAERMPGGRISGNPRTVVEAALTAKFGRGEWTLPGGGETNVYLNSWTVQNAHASEHEIYQVASKALLENPRLHVARVYTREQLENGIQGDFIARAEMNGYNPKRSGDLAIVFEPGYVPGTSGTTHFSPYRYDTHVPVLFMGPGIKPGRYDERIEPNDIAPTLTNMLDVQTPSGSSGRVLREMLVR